MQFLDINGVKRIKRYTDDTFVTSEDISEIEDASLDFYTKSEIDEMISDVEAEIQSGGGGITSETDPVFTASPAHGITSANISTWNAKQNALVSGTNIKTVNGESLLGSGNVTINKIGTGTVGSSMMPVYINNGSPTAISSFPEAYLSWGGKNFNASYGPIDAAMVSELGACRTMFAKASCITIEYSTDGGQTWVDYEATDTQKLNLFSTGATAFYTGKNTTAGGGSVNNLLRVSLKTANNIYTSLNKFVVFCSTNGSTGCYCTIRSRTQENLENDIDTWAVRADQIPISGWTGYNVINVAGITTYGNVKASQHGEIQFIFGYTGYSGSSQGLYILKIFGFGGVGWVTPSSMAKTGHLYSFDSLQNAVFPANVTASKIIKSGGTSSQFLKADGSVDSNSYATTSALSAKQDALVSGTNIKTINGTSILGSGNISISGTGGGEANVIETIKVNGTALTPDSNKAVDVTVPTKVSDLTDDVVSGSYLPLTGGNMNSGALIRLRNSSFSMVLQPFGIVKESNEQSHALYLPDKSGTIALTSDLPTKVSDLTNDSGFTTNTGTITGITMNGASKGTSGVVDLGTVLTSYTETDPTVPAWAKAATKPTYTASEVGALPSTTTIPSTLDQISDGTTRKLSNYLPLTGGTLSGNLNIGGDYGVEITQGEGESGFTVKADSDKTIYGLSEIENYGETITIPQTTGTMALTSQIPTSLASLSTDSSHRTVTDTEKSTWNAKQNAITISSSEPTSSQGSNGDIWIVI